MTIDRIAAFAEGETGGNPAGVHIAETLPSPADMQRIAAEVGFSETAFAAPEGAGWRVRYFAPEREVPFCGHATIALGAALGARGGAGVYPLTLNDGEISVEALADDDGWAAALVSPPTWSEAPDPALKDAALGLFDIAPGDLAADMPVWRISSGGADQLMIPLASRGRLARLDYDQAAGADLLNAHALVGAYFVHRDGPRAFSARLAFPTGGVYEDPATGAAAAAFSGWLRDDGRLTGEITIMQGEDMGAPSRLTAVSGPEKGAPVRVSGATRRLA